MINWDEMSGLHVIAKLETILAQWFDLELIYVDQHGRIMSSQLSKEHSFKNEFLKLQLNTTHGHQYLQQDIEKLSEQFYGNKNDELVGESFFPHVKSFSHQVMIDGEHLGFVLAYPFLTTEVTEQNLSELKSKMIDTGVAADEAEDCVSKMRKMSEKDIDYLQALVSLVSGEVMTYHEEISTREARIQELNSELGDKYRYHSMIGKSKKMQQIYRLLEKISSSDSSVFVQGENGTGKELVAKAVHFTSPRKDNTFLAVNCSAFNDNLLDSELFGHVKGAFTGAIKDKKGLFEQANGGTLFLDEIGDTSLSMQVKLLRVLQEGTFLPVGAASPVKVDVRIIAATNRNLKEMMAKGEFREDLFYRINVINIQLPPLRERREDISLLIDHFLEKRCAESGLATKVLSKKTMEKLLDYNYPGNVRELENEIERLVVLAGADKTITPDHLSARILEQGQKHIESASPIQRGLNTNGNLKDALVEVEKVMIREGLRRCNFNKSKLAKELGISRASLIMKVDKYELDKRKKASGE